MPHERRRDGGVERSLDGEGGKSVAAEIKVALGAGDVEHPLVRVDGHHVQAEVGEPAGVFAGATAEFEEAVGVSTVSVENRRDESQVPVVGPLGLENVVERRMFVVETVGHAVGRRRVPRAVNLPLLGRSPVLYTRRRTILS